MIDPDPEAVLWLAVEDYAGLWEVTWELRALHSHLPEKELLEKSRLTIVTFLTLDWVQLYRCQEPYGDLTVVPAREAETVTRLDASWEMPQPEGISIRIGATPTGEEAYGYRASPHTDVSQPSE